VLWVEAPEPSLRIVAQLAEIYSIMHVIQIDPDEISILGKFRSDFSHLRKKHGPLNQRLEIRVTKTTIDVIPVHVVQIPSMVGEAVNIDLYESWLSVKTKEFEVWRRYRSVNIKPLFNQNEWLDVLVGPLLKNIIVIHSHPGLGDYFQLVDVEPDISVVKLDQAASVIRLHDEAIGEVLFAYFGGVLVCAVKFDQMSLRPKLFSHIVTHLVFIGKKSNQGTAVEQGLIKNLFIKCSGPN
jgi:hypothetical protein